jgi:hypothetical protein
MKSAFALAALIAAFLLPACATKPPPTMVLRQGGNTLTLMMTPCNAKVSSLLKPEFVAQFKNASAVVDGQAFEACWIMHDSGVVYVHFEDGDTAMIPVESFIKTAERPKPKAKIDDWRHNA